MTADLLEEYTVAAGAISNRDIEALEGLGVPAEIASGVLPDWPMVGAARVATNSSGLYEPHESGAPHYVCPCIDGDDITDIVAWRPGNPSNWWMRRGSAVLLNPQEPARVAMAQEWDEDAPRLLVSATPLDWLRARCCGVVILNWRRSIPFHFTTVARIECASETLAARLRAAYAIHDCPRIFFQKESNRAA